MIFIVTRHQGAIDWLAAKHITGETRDSLAVAEIAALPPKSIVVGVLPLHLAVAVIQAGHRFISLQLELERWQRGRELSAEEIDGIASLRELQLQWRRLGSDWQSNFSECWSGIPEPSAGDCQEFRIGLVPRSAGDIVEHEILDGEPNNPPRYSPRVL